jgi:hypothetical protein
VRFLHYRCADCAMSDIFVDILPLEGESDETFHRRRDEMEVVVRQMHNDQMAAVVIPVSRER